MDDLHNKQGSFFILVRTNSSCILFSVHANTHLLVSQTANQKTLIVVHRTLTSHFHLALVASSGQLQPQLRWLIKSGNLSKSWLTYFQSGVLDQEYLVTPSLLDEMLNFVNSSLS